MAINTYYQDELTYLREMGRVFADENPKLAPFLARDADDPDVERLLEGFAFLTARLRQRLNEDLPELAHNLLQLVWPHYLRPVPPITVLKFDPAKGVGSKAPVVPRGTMAQSRPIQGVNCQFRTVYDVHPLPLAVDKLTLDSQATTSRLLLEFAVSERGDLSALADKPLTLFFSADRDDQIVRTLYLFVLNHLRRVRATAGAGHAVELAPSDVTPRGFDRRDALLDYPANSFDGFRVIQEYFAYPTKFMFVDVKGLKPLAGAPADRLVLEFQFDRPFPEEARVSERHVTINATPAVNLFDHDSQPIIVDQSKSEYHVVPSGGLQKFSVASVRTVSGWARGGGRRIEYAPFESFRHDQPHETDKPRYYRTRIRPSVVGRGVDHYLSFLTRLDTLARPAVETVSVGLVCTNGALAERVGVGTIDQPTATTPANLVFSNILPVTGEIPPPAEDDILWRLIANLARNFGSLVDPDALRTTLSAYEFRAIHDLQARRRLELMSEAIVDFRHSGIDLVINGRPVRGRQITLDVVESKIGGEAELFLFGAVLDAFFTAYASVNSLHRFAVQGTETKAEFTWKPRRGTAVAF